MQGLLCTRDCARNCVCSEEISTCPPKRIDRDKCSERGTTDDGLRVTERGLFWV